MRCLREGATARGYNAETLLWTHGDDGGGTSESDHLLEAEENFLPFPAVAPMSPGREQTRGGGPGRTDKP